MSKKSIELLNKAIADELTAVHRYMYFHFHCDDQGFDLLADLSKRIAVKEMLHVERLAERILFLQGDVDMSAIGKVKVVKDVSKMLEIARKMEDSSVNDNNKWANECSKSADSASRKIFEDLVLDEGRHRDQYENELDNMSRFGENYLDLQSIERSKRRSAGPAE